MNPSRLFIERPVATSLLMFAILLVGIVAYQFLPLSALPDVDYPTIQVQTFYPGASPEVMASSVTAPLERQFGQMANLQQMLSASSGGASVITLRFGLDLAIDVAEQEVQAAINAAGNLLPADLPAPPIYAKVNPADAPILTLGVTSKTMKLTDIEDIDREPARAEAVAASRRRPGLDLRRPAALGAHPRQSAGAGGLRDQPRRSAHDRSPISTSTRRRAISTGRRNPTRSTPTIRSATRTTISTSVVAYRNNAPVRLRDVATVEIGAENDRLSAWMQSRTPALDRQHPAPAGRERHPGRRQHQEAAAAAHRLAAGGDRRSRR